MQQCACSSVHVESCREKAGAALTPILVRASCTGAAHAPTAGVGVGVVAGGSVRPEADGVPGQADARQGPVPHRLRRRPRRDHRRDPRARLHRHHHQ
eukprot:2380789-Rhodomonas_salina.1